VRNSPRSVYARHHERTGGMGLDLVRRDGRDRLRDLERSHEQGEVLMKGIFTGLFLAALMAEASAQSAIRSFYDAAARAAS
jgi:hypothetical protein